MVSLGIFIPLRCFENFLVQFIFMYTKFEPMPPTQTFHIIWNVLLADKQLKLTPEVFDAEQICHVVAILPHKSDFLELNRETTMPYTVLEYGDHHDTIIDRKQFEQCGEFIDSLAKKEGRRNVLIFCNNGYQRSIPFLVYYLTTFHPTEIPTIEKALSIILSQVDRENYNKTLPSMVESITRLLH
jgi:hypothetical protein